MVNINNEEIRDTYNYLATIENILKKEIKMVEGNKNHIDKMVPDFLFQHYSTKERSWNACSKTIRLFQVTRKICGW